MKYIDLVTVVYSETPSLVNLFSDKPIKKQYLFVAPAWSHLEPGTEVMTETSHGPQRAFVVSSCTVDSDLQEAETQMIVKLTNATLPLKRILSKSTWRDLDYSDYKDEETNNEQTESEKTE